MPTSLPSSQVSAEIDANQAEMVFWQDVAMGRDFIPRWVNRRDLKLVSAYHAFINELERSLGLQ